MRVRTRPSSVRLAVVCACLIVCLALSLGATSAIGGPLTLSAPQPVAATAARELVADIDGSRILWVERVGDDDLFVRDIAHASPTLRLTDNATAESWASLSGSTVVWQGTDGDTEIYYRNLAEPMTVKITDNTWADSSPSLDGNRVVWMSRQDGGDNEIALYDPSVSANVEYLTENTATDAAPKISGPRVAWVSDEEIYLLDMRTRQISQLTHNAWPEFNPELSASRVLWGARSPFGTDLVTQTFGGQLQLRTYAPPIATVFRIRSDGSLIAWYTGETNPNADLWVWDTASGGGPVRLTDNDSGENPAVGFDLDDPYIVWSDYDGADRELKIWDKSSRAVSTLTSNSTYDVLPRISGTRIAWDHDYSGETDVHTATLVKSATALTLTAPSTINYGASAKVSGALKSGSSVLAGRKIALEYSSNGTTWKAWKTVTTSSAGTFAAYAKPVRRTFYRAKFAGDAAYAPKTSVSKRVLPRVYLSKPSGPTSVTHGTSFSSAGYLKPRHTAGTKPVRILCYRKVSGVYRLKKTYYAKVSNYSTYSKYKASVKLPDPGSWRIRAYYPTTTTNYKKYSTYRYITAK